MPVALSLFSNSDSYDHTALTSGIPVSSIPGLVLSVGIGGLIFGTPQGVSSSALAFPGVIWISLVLLWLSNTCCCIDDFIIYFLIVLVILVVLLPFRISRRHLFRCAAVAGWLPVLLLTQALHIPYGLLIASFVVLQCAAVLCLFLEVDWMRGGWPPPIAALMLTASGMAITLQNWVHFRFTFWIFFGVSVVLASIETIVLLVYFSCEEAISKKIKRWKTLRCILRCPVLKCLLAVSRKEGWKTLRCKLRWPGLVFRSFSGSVKLNEMSSYVEHTAGLGMSVATILLGFGFHNGDLDGLLYGGLLGFGIVAGTRGSTWGAVAGLGTGLITTIPDGGLVCHTNFSWIAFCILIFIVAVLSLVDYTGVPSCTCSQNSCLLFSCDEHPQENDREGGVRHVHLLEQHEHPQENDREGGVRDVRQQQSTPQYIVEIFRWLFVVKSAGGCRLEDLPPQGYHEELFRWNPSPSHTRTNYVNLTEWLLPGGKIGVVFNFLEPRSLFKTSDEDLWRWKHVVWASYACYGESWADVWHALASRTSPERYDDLLKAIRTICRCRTSVDRCDWRTPPIDPDVALKERIYFERMKCSFQKMKDRVLGDQDGTWLSDNDVFQYFFQFIQDKKLLEINPVVSRWCRKFIAEARCARRVFPGARRNTTVSLRLAACYHNLHNQWLHREFMNNDIVPVLSDDNESNSKLDNTGHAEMRARSLPTCLRLAPDSNTPSFRRTSRRESRCIGSPWSIFTLSNWILASENDVKTAEDEGRSVDPVNGADGSNIPLLLETRLLM